MNVNVNVNVNVGREARGKSACSIGSERGSSEAEQQKQKQAKARTGDARDEFEWTEHAAGAQDLQAAHVVLLALAAGRLGRRLFQQRDQPASTQCTQSSNRFTRTQEFGAVTVAV